MRALAAAAVLSLAGSTPAAERPPILVELFTSEGCSSCPPADALLARLSASAGPPVIVLGEHVDYWDHLGWRDPAAAATFTRRQQAYARRLGSSVYTPQVVVGGRAEAVGSSEDEVRSAIAAAPAPTGRLWARLTGDRPEELAVEATWPEGSRADVLLASVQPRLTSAVARGENAGRTLEHVAVVRALTVVGSGTGAFAGRVALPPRSSGVERLVLFVQEPDGGPVHAALEVSLP
jgi:hypothetical protein